jgi:hypothetical protein
MAARKLSFFKRLLLSIARGCAGIAAASFTAVGIGFPTTFADFMSFSGGKLFEYPIIAGKVAISVLVMLYVYLLAAGFCKRCTEDLMDKFARNPKNKWGEPVTGTGFESDGV